MIKINGLGVVAALLLSALNFSAIAQTQSQPLVMSLEQCLDYAKEHSITLQRYQLQVDDSTISESDAKSAFLPTVSASVGQNLVSTPFNSIGSDGYYSGSYGVDASMTLYNGGENNLSLQQSKLSTKIAELGLLEQESTLELSITQIYVEILYAMEQITVMKSSLALSEMNVERGALQLELGSINEADYAQLLTAVATAQYNVIVAETSLKNMYVQLKHLLDIADDVTLMVDSSQITTQSVVSAIPSVSTVYTEALEIRPEIEASTLGKESALIDQSIAKTGYMPTVSLSAGVGVNHTSGSSYTFSNQLRNNYSNSIGLNISIPIFNRYVNKNNVARAQNSVKSAELSYTEQTKNLYQTIESLHNNAVNAEAMYLVSQTKLKALETSLSLVTQQYELGLKDIIDLLTEQDNYRTSSQEYLESKYTLILNKAILEYYKSGIIKL